MINCGKQKVRLLLQNSADEIQQLKNTASGLRDEVRGLARRGARVLKETAFNLMTADVIVGKTGSDVNEIMREMSQSRIRHMPIVEKEKLIGLISIGDVVKNRIEELEAEGNMLREYISNG